MLNISVSRQQGFMAVVLVVFLVVFVAIAAAIVSMTTSGTRSAADHVNAISALFAAESGVEWAASSLAGAADPTTACNDLSSTPGANGSVNGAGTYSIEESSYDPADEGCFIKSRGQVVESIRYIEGKIPSSVIEGGGGGNDLFDDEDNWNSVGGGNEIVDGVLYIRQQGSDTAKAQDGDDALSDDFQAGDAIYFAANVDPDASGLTVTLTFPGPPGNYATCTAGDPCSTVDPDNPLLDSYNTVWLLDGSVSGSRADVNQIEIIADFNHYSVSEVAIADACIGRLSHCQMGGGDDPVGDGTWDENP